MGLSFSPSSSCWSWCWCMPLSFPTVFQQTKLFAHSDQVLILQTFFPAKNACSHDRSLKIHLKVLITWTILFARKAFFECKIVIKFTYLLASTRLVYAMTFSLMCTRSIMLATADVDGLPGMTKPRLLKIYSKNAGKSF